MSWFTERTPSGRAGHVRPWLPPISRQPSEAPPAAEAPPLRFDEGELARVSARLVDRTVREARAAEAASLAARQAAVLERLAAAFEAAVRDRTAAERDLVPRIVALAAAIAQALGPAARDPAGLAALAADMIAGIGASTIRLSAAPEAIEILRPLLPDITARAGFGGTVELEAAPRLADGALRIAWPGGWLARDPEAAARQVAALLAPLHARPVSDPISLQGTPDDQS
ncbi:MAG: hypothetical protein AB7I59_10420 [Geminicoccaceae bacterium]